MMKSRIKESSIAGMMKTVVLVGGVLLFFWGYVQIVPDSHPTDATFQMHPESVSITHDRFTRREKNTWHLQGTVSNRSEQKFGRVVIKIDLLDEHGEVMISDYAILNGALTLQPGENWRFQISKAIHQHSNSLNDEVREDKS